MFIMMALKTDFIKIKKDVLLDLVFIIIKYDFHKLKNY